jgi:hypothetical protein
MSNSDDIPRLERPSFFDGQRLRALDLTAPQFYNQELRWLHNRSLHGWGIAFGFAVDGSQGAKMVQIRTGYAIDCMGRDLVLDAPIEMPIPAAASASHGGATTYYLTVSYAEDEQLIPITRSGACKSSGAVRRPEMPLVRWQDPNDTNPSSRYRFGVDVVLASVKVLNCQLAEEVSAHERRDAVPPQQPYIAAGRTRAGETGWRLWPDDNEPLGVATTVPTSAAGFQMLPGYQAHVIGERMFQAEAGGDTFFVDGYAQIAQATAFSFEVQIILPEGTTVGVGKPDTFSFADYRVLITRIANANPNISAKLILPDNGKVLTVGTTMVSFWPDLRPLGQLVTNDFKGALEKISERNGISFDDLLVANRWDQDLKNVIVTLGQKVAIPGPVLALNPPKIFKSEFMEILSKDLAWHVTWMGVEG